MIGLYQHGTSPVHRAPVKAKLALVPIAGLAVSILDTPAALGLALGGPAALLVASRIPMKPILTQLKPVLVLMALIMAVQLPAQGWRNAMVADLRLAVLAFTAAVLTLTTRVSDLVREVQRVAGRFSRFGIDPSKVSLALSMTIRFIPLLMEKAREVRDAQRARGVEKSILALCVPLLIKSLQVADQTSEALQARGLD